MTLDTRDLHRPIALSLLLVLAGYYAGSIVGIQLGLPPSGIGATWPPTAILLGALLLAPPRYWWMYLVGVVPAHLHVVASFQLPEVPFVVRLCQVGSNILLAVLAALLLRFEIGAPPRFASLRNMGAFILLAVLATAVASAVAIFLFLLTGWAADFWLAWRQRVLANVFAIVTIPPVIVLACAGQLVGAHATWRSYLELALITVGVLVVGIPVFALESPGPSNLPALLLAPLPFLIWAAVRVGVGGTGLTLLIVAGIALANAYVGRGPFISQAPEVNVFSLQIFLTAISIPVLLLAGLVEERRQAEEALKQTSKQAERALVERDAQLALAGKIALVGAYAVDIDTEKVQLSAGCAAIHGFPEGTTEIHRNNWRAGVHPVDLARLDELFRQAFSERWPEYTADYRIIRSGGEVRWIEARAFISYNVDGCADRIVGVNIDVTERKRAEAALEQSEARYRALYDDNPSMYFTVDAVGTVLSVNEFGARRLGYTPADLVGQSVLQVVHEEDREAVRQHLASCSEKPETVAATELRKVHRDGSIMWVREVARAVRESAAQQTVLLIVCEEITERKRAEERLRMLVAELDHRVKNALATVAAVTSRTQDASGSITEFVTALDGRIQSMAATHQLLSNHQWKGILLSDLVGRELAPYAAHGNTEIDGPEVTLKADAAQAVSMVLHELTTNAAKHGALSAQGGRISVRWYQRALNGDADAPLRIEWQEVGGPVVQAPARSGYGMEVIRGLLPYELDGKVDLAFASTGVQCFIDIPVSQLANGWQATTASSSAS